MAKVFSHFSATERAYVVSLVCKRWRAVCELEQFWVVNPYLPWKPSAFNQTSEEITNQQLQHKLAYLDKLQRHSHGLRTIQLADTCYIGDAELRAFRSFRNLEKLGLKLVGMIEYRGSPAARYVIDAA